MTSSLFIGIGNRDLQAIYTLPTGERRRQQIRPDKVPSGLPVLTGNGVWEHDREKDPKVENPIGICFPILEKTINCLRDENITYLDRLFILCTDRSQVVPKLLNIRAAWEENVENINDLYEYLDRGLIRWALNDPSTDTSELLKNKITSKELKYEGIEIGETIVLKLGTYGRLNSINKLNPAKKIMLEDLEIADINTLDFFEDEIHHALMPFYKHLQNSNLYLGTHAGGMPLMLRGLDSVLVNVLPYARYRRIFASEYGGATFQKRKKNSFPELMGQMNQSVISMEWNHALHCLEQLESRFCSQFPDGRLADLRRILNGAKAMWEAEGTWFERFAAHILRALYTSNLNEIVVWLSCLEQAARLELARKQIGKLWISLDEKRGIVELSQPVNGIKHVDLEFGKLRLYVDENKLKEAFADYIGVFLNPNTLGFNAEWEKIRMLRNDLIHQGKAPARNSNAIPDINCFIGIDPIKLQDAIVHIKQRNLQELILFETKVLENPFFSVLGKICGFKGDMLKERGFSKRFFETLHRT